MSEQITVNGKPREINGDVPLPEFLRAHDINPRLVAIAVNGDVVPRDRYGEIIVRPGDALEIVRMVGGGA
ncbi:MAG: sulfur carrier protein ThiS [Chloroflexi bacterium]|nr:sulfur carrier protein ThiS [Chloroflexota bacterium]